MIKKESFENQYRRMCRTGEIAHYDLRAFSRPDNTVDHGTVTVTDPAEEDGVYDDEISANEE